MPQIITRVRPRTFRCPCEACQGSPGPPAGFCAAHLATLAGIREDFEVRRHALSRDGLRERSPQRPLCTTVGCWNDRQPPLPVCRECAEEAE